MTRRRLKALKGIQASFAKHIGHEMTLRTGDKFKLADVMIDHRQECVFLRAEGETFATIYCENVKFCSCGEGQTK